jgi:hypothetical protein
MRMRTRKVGARAVGEHGGDYERVVSSSAHIFSRVLGGPLGALSGVKAFALAGFGFWALKPQGSHHHLPSFILIFTRVPTPIHKNESNKKLQPPRVLLSLQHLASPSRSIHAE